MFRPGLPAFFAAEEGASATWRFRRASTTFSRLWLRLIRNRIRSTST